MRKRLFIEILIFFQIMAFWGLGRANAPFGKKDGPSSEEPVVITSQKMDFDNLKRKAVYSGGVKVVKGAMILTAERLEVYFSETGQGVERIDAYDQVKIWWKDAYAESEVGVYDGKAQTITLSGSPKSWQGENMVKGEKITYNLGEDRIMVEGGVETIIHIESDLLGRAVE